ncbi:HU family DNA-binding protein [Ferrimonas sp. YFM]|uniref:HU family DNA-binding protein n=1 Tax=Ferrimonas sp. YFM TaxID=3028878 RepID=UPI002572BBA4|nr:HU family DNA-binding protein [Ferrimonas sp. YFM]
MALSFAPNRIKGHQSVPANVDSAPKFRYKAAPAHQPERPMNRKQLIQTMAARSGLSQSQCQASLTQLLATIAQALHEGEKVYLPKLGVFEVRHHLPKSGRNPITGETIEIPFRSSAAFRPSDALKAAIKG